MSSFLMAMAPAFQASLCPQAAHEMHPLVRGVKLTFTGGHITLMVVFKEPNVILGLYKCNYSLTVKGELVK